MELRTPFFRTLLLTSTVNTTLCLSSFSRLVCRLGERRNFGFSFALIPFMEWMPLGFREGSGCSGTLHGSRLIFSLTADKLSMPWSRKLLCRIPHAKLDHAHREANAVADKLSKMGLDAPPGFHLLSTAPLPCNLHIRADLQGVSFPRSCHTAGILLFPP